MKAEYDKEIDSLLRESARRGRAASGEGRARADGGAHAASHLDADEQGAYAENALPVAARAHYAAHLADCDDCRRSVTQLALAAGMPAQLESSETATAKTVSPDINWRERLGALFAPRAWRYAVPALALLLVSAVSLIVFTRRAQKETSIAERSAPNAQRPQVAQPQPQQQQPEAHHAQQNDAAAAARGGESAMAAPDPNASPSNPNALPSKEEIAANNSGRGEVAQPLVGRPLNEAIASGPPPPAPSSVGGGSASGITVSPTPAPTPAPVSESVTMASADETKVRSNLPPAELRTLERKPGEFDNRQYENRRREQVSGPRRNEQARNARTADADEPRNRADKQDGNPAATTAPAQRPAAKRARQTGTTGSKDENRQAEDAERSEGARAASAAETRTAETRTVAGRKFRRQGDGWVDTAYNARQSYTVVKRNSEQFRALVADEPEIRRVAAALGGEVTVVWKGRAYRIR